MGWFTSMATLVLVWWVVLFTILPLRMGEADQQADQDTDPDESPAEGPTGHQPGAPARTHLRWKLKVTTLVALVVWLVILAIAWSGLFEPGDIPRWFGMD